MLQRIIMLADDDSDNTEMFCEAVEIAAKDVICHSAVNGEELLKKLYALDLLPEVIFLDMNMPVMNGLQSLKAIKSDRLYKNIPVIMMSTSSHNNEVEFCLENDALYYLVKPTNFNSLMAVVREVLNNPGAIKDALDNLKVNDITLYTR